jgi:branched-chain amino acid transport system permease protein
LFFAAWFTSKELQTIWGHIKQMKHFRTLAVLAIILLIAIMFPILIGDATSDPMAIEVLLLIGAAVAWNIFSGYTGYISLGHATYFGLGGYTLALVSQMWNIPGGYEPFLLLPLAGLVAGAFSVPLGWIALHTRRYTFMVITIAIFFIFQLLAYNLGSITGGASGIFLPLPPWSSDFADVPFYYVALLLVSLLIFVSWWIRNARYGLALLAIRDDEDRARGLGIRIDRYKLGAYVISAAFTGMIGALAIYFAGLVTPSSAFDQTLDISIITMTFFGGVGSVMGPIVGGLLLEPVQTYLAQQFGTTASGINQVLFGCFLLLVILLLPEGIVPSLQKRWSLWRTARTRPGTTWMPSPALLLFPSPTLEAALTPLSEDSGSILPEAIPIQSRPILLPSPAFEATLTPLSEDSGSILPEAIPIQSRPIERQPYTTPLAIPHFPREQVFSVPALPQITQKVRAPRLVPLSQSASITLSEPVATPPVVSWRCPNCRKPFLIKGNSCYCPRCGFTRPLAN